MARRPKLTWDVGTAYDLFVSLMVLHEPAEFGVRGAWAAGVRARMPAEARAFLEESRPVAGLPLHWVYELPEPKDALTALWALRQIPVEERLPRLGIGPDTPAPVANVLLEVAVRGQWTSHDREALQALMCEDSGSTPVSVDTLLEWWARPGEFGERYLEALKAYEEAFFGEEEERIGPALLAALSRGQQLAGRSALPDLLDDLSQGVRFDDLPPMEELVLAPSYWITPLMLFGKAGAGRELWLFGARPTDASLVPGEAVPDGMLRALKALSDPTRLRIMHYLAGEPQTPAELARRLRLRAPTVTHHLKALRLAGLVQLTVGEDRDSRRYAARSGAIPATFASLESFLQGESTR